MAWRAGWGDDYKGLPEEDEERGLQKGCTWRVRLSWEEGGGGGGGVFCLALRWERLEHVCMQKKRSQQYEERS